MKEKENSNSEVEAAKINAEGTIIASKINTKGAIIVAVIALIATIGGTFLGSILEANKGQVNIDQEIQNQLDQALKKIEELEKQLYESKNDNRGNSTSTLEPTPKPTLAPTPEPTLAPTPEHSLSPEDQFIKNNIELIKQLKAGYSEADTRVIESDSVHFEVCENAGYIYQDIMKTSGCEILEGIQVSNAKIIILDCDSDEIVRSYEADKWGRVDHLPGNQKNFYCVVFHDNYNIYVSSPFRVVGGESYNSIDICLERINSEYTPLFQFRIRIHDLILDETYSIDSSEYIARFRCEDAISKEYNMTYGVHISDVEILSLYNKTYFSLNTNYIMDFFLDFESDSKLKSTHVIFDGSVKNTNIIDVNLVVEYAE